MCCNDDVKAESDLSDKILKKTLNPFDANTDVLTNMVADALEDLCREDGILALYSNAKFKPEMIQNMDQSQNVGDALTKELGYGFWSSWYWTAQEAQEALDGATKRAALLKWAMGFYDGREKELFGYVRGLH